MKLTTLILTYDRTKTCHFHADGRLSINNNPEELAHTSFPYSPPNFQKFLERRFKIHNFRTLPKNHIVTEGRTLTTGDGSEWEIYVGMGLSAGQKNRAWLAYKERVIDSVQLPTQDSPTLLAEACTILKNNFNKSVKLETTTPTSSELLKATKQIEVHVRSIFISLVEAQKTFVIRNGSYNPYLDQIARSCTAVYANVYKAASDADTNLRREAIYGLQGTQLGHEVTWAWLTRLVDTDQIPEAISRLCELAPSLLETEAMHLFCSKLARKIDSSQLFSFVVVHPDNGQVLERVKNLLCGQTALLALEKGDPETAYQNVHSGDVEASVAIKIADHFVTKNQIDKAISILFSVTRSIEIQKWFVTTADKLWSENKYKQALLLIGEISGVTHWGEADELWLIENPHELWIIDQWFLSIADKLWKEGENHRAIEIATRVKSTVAMSNWFFLRSNELFREGDISEAAKMVARNCSFSKTKLEWFEDKADVLLGKGKVGQAFRMIALSQNEELPQRWCLLKADQFLKEGKFTDAVRFIEYSPLNDKVKEDWFSAKSGLYKEIRREPDKL